MKSLKNKTITIFGGTGFLGRHLISKLARTGASLYIVTRSQAKVYFLKPYGDIGQITPVCISLKDEYAIETLIKESDMVINLVGILHEKKRGDFDYFHHQLPALIARLANKHSIEHFVHISAIGASPEQKCRYLKTKALGERAILKNCDQATIIRPSIIFGNYDSFFHRFAKLFSIPGLFILPLLIGGGKTKFQPVYVGDVVQAILAVLGQKKSYNTIYEIAGPRIYSFKELLHYIKNVIGHGPLLCPIPFWAAKIKAFFLQFLPNPPLTPDQVRALQSDNIASGTHKTAKDLDIETTSLESKLPDMLSIYKRDK